MHPLEYAVILLFALAAVRTFSFGIYGLKNNNPSLFGVALFAIAAGAGLLWRYVILAM